MSLEEDETILLSPSYFWSCATLDTECPFFTDIDPKLWYFGVGIALLYGAFLVMVLGDVGFYWSLDNLQCQIDHYINLVTRKVKRVHMDQRRLMTTQERTEKLLKKSQDCKRIVNSLRGILTSDDSHHLTIPTSFDDCANTEEGQWNTNTNSMEY